MKISKRTVEVLKNLQTINPSIVVKPGNTLSTVTKLKNILATIEVDEHFDTEFAIYDLSRFLGLLSLSNDPEVEFGKTALQISSGKNTIDYTYAEPSNIIQPPNNAIELPSVDVSFSLGDSELQKILKAASIMQLPNLAFYGDGSKVYLKAFSEKDPSSNVSKVELGETDKTFSAIFKVEYFKMLPNDYDIEVCSKGIAKFSADDGRINYWIALESSSDFS